MANMQAQGCPFASNAQFSSDDVKMCPMAHAVMPANSSADGVSAPTCPLGFGTARGPKLSTLHCPVCKGLLFDAHKVVSCQHTFCRACITQTRDCPSCGRDVDSLEPNAELSRLVDTFLDTHSNSPALVAAQVDVGPLPDHSAASFFMAQGLQSLAGGNVHAALHRLGRAKQALMDTSLAPTTPAGTSPAAAAAAVAASTSGTAAAQDDAAAGGACTDADSMDADVQWHSSRQGQAASAASAAAAVSRAVQLATLCGCMGDCYQRLGQGEQAETLYKEAVAAVEGHAEVSAEAAHAMSVSLNKLGDGHYLRQQLPSAKGLYKQALQLRQLCCGPLTSGRAGPQEQLDLASALIKVADVCKALGENEEAEHLLSRAHGVCCEVAAWQGEAELPPPVSRKLQMLQGVLQAQRQTTPEGLLGVGAAAAAGSDS